MKCDSSEVDITHLGENVCYDWDSLAGYFFSTAQKIMG